MIGRYSLPSDDLLAAVPTAVITASAEDPAYPVTNWAFRQPGRPSKLLTADGWWVFDLLEAVNVAAFALIYHNFDPDLTVTLQWNSSDSWGSPAGEQDLTIPNRTEDDYTVSPWITVEGSPTYRYWRLLVTGTNGQALKLGRPYFSGALRDLGDAESIEQDVRWGVQEDEQFSLIEHVTEADLENIYEIGGKRRPFSGELALSNTNAATFIALERSARTRVFPWLLIPDVTVNEALMVRFEENKWQRTRDTINQNVFPFRVRELSRGLDWP